MCNYLLWILLICCCCDKNGAKPYGCDSKMHRKSCHDKQAPRPRCVMPADERFICKADNEEPFLDEKECE